MSVHEIISKVARLAVSKAAGFSYAVAVGVAANLAFHFVQPHQPEPVAMTAPQEARPVADGAVAGPADAAAIAPKPALPAASPSLIPAPTQTHISPSAARAKPAAPASAVAPAVVLPEPPAQPLLPSAASLPSPALKPAPLPSEAILNPTPAPPPDAAPSPAPQQAAGLKPLGPAIDVASPPMPPVETPIPPTRAAMPPAAAIETATTEGPPGGLELRDVWHPGRAVEKGLHWAARQVPLIGDADAEPHSKTAAPAAPIPLFPSRTKPVSLESSDAAPSPKEPAAPGPGSGGLY
jgi:hypothetical protein